MSTLVIANVAGNMRGEPVRLPARRRRLSTIAARHAPAGRYFLSVYRKGEPVGHDPLTYGRSRKDWSRTLVGKNDTVLITTVTRGGGSGLRIGLAIASIALMALAPVIAGPLASALGLGGTSILGFSGAQLVQAGLVTAGLAAGLWAQRAKGNQKESKFFGVTGGGNLPRAGERKPWWFGRCKTQPPLSQYDVTRYDGDAAILLKRMTCRLGKMVAHGVYAGDVKVWDEEDGLLPPFDDSGDRTTRTGQGANSASANARNAVEFVYEQPSQIMPGEIVSSPDVNGIQVPRSFDTPNFSPFYPATPPGVRARSFTFDRQWPGGIFRETDKREQRPSNSIVVIEGQEIDDLGNPIGAIFEFFRDSRTDTKTTKAIRVSDDVDAPDPTKRYQFRIRDIAAKDPGTMYTESLWDGLRANIPDPKVRPKTTELIMRIRGGPGLSVTSFSNIWVDATAIEPVWNGAEWVEEPTRKAVWAAAAVIRSSHGRNLPNGFDANAALALTQRMTEDDEFNGLLPNVSRLPEALSEILGVIRADPIRVGGLYTIARDEPKAAQRFVFTRRQTIASSGRARYQFKGEEGTSDVIVEYDREGDPQRSDYVRAWVGQKTRTPKRYKVNGITTPEHAIRHARWLAACAVFRAAERTIEVEWDGRLVYPGDLIHSEMWFLKGQRTGGAMRRIPGTLTLELDCDLKAPTSWSYGNIRNRRGREAGVLRMRGTGTPRQIELHPEDVENLEIATDLAIDDILASPTQDPTTITIAESLQEIQRSYVARAAVPVGPGRVQIQMVRDDPRVWEFLGEDVVVPVPIEPSLVDPVMPEIRNLSARCVRIETGIAVSWTIDPGRGVKSYEVALSYGGGTWEPIYNGPLTTGIYPMRQSDTGAALLRARALKDGLPPGAWFGPVSFGTIEPTIHGRLLEPETIDFDALIPDTVPLIIYTAQGLIEEMRQRIAAASAMTKQGEQIMADLLATVLRSKESGIREQVRATTAITTRIDQNGALIAEQRSELLAFQGNTTAALTNLYQVKVDAAGASAIVDTRIALQKQSGELVTGVSLISTLSGYATDAEAAAIAEQRIAARIASGDIASQAWVNQSIGSFVTENEAVSIADQRIEAQKNSGTLVTSASLGNTLLAYATEAEAQAIADQRIQAQKTSGELVTSASLANTLIGYATDNEALSVAQQQANAVYNNVTANGQVALTAYAAPWGFTSAWFVRLIAGNIKSALGVAARSDGTSAAVIEATGLYVQDPNIWGGVPVPMMQVSGGNLMLANDIHVGGNAVIGGEIYSSQTNSGGIPRMIVGLSSSKLEFWDG